MGKGALLSSYDHGSYTARRPRTTGAISSELTEETTDAPRGTSRRHAVVMRSLVTEWPAKGAANATD